MDTVPDARSEKDALTVEIMFALTTAVALGMVVFAAFWVPALVVGVSEPAGRGLLRAGTLLAIVAGAWRVTRVLRRFGACGRQGH